MARIRSKQLQLAAAGDILVGGTSGFGSNLTIGSEGQVLKVVSGVLSWAASSTTGAFVYKGTVDASTTAVLNGITSPVQGDYYRVTTAGDSFPTAASVQRNVGDAVVFNGTTWDAIDNTDPTVAGTTNRISVSGDGVTAPYTVDIDAAYVGQASITTLGTVTSGTWNGTAIGGVYGGTGLTSTTTNGVLIGATGNTFAFTAAPTTTGQVLSWNGTNIVWAAGGAGTVTTGTSQGTGSAVYDSTNSTSTTLAFNSLVAGSTKISISAPVAGDITFDVVEANLALNNIGGTLGVAKGGTGLTTIAANSALVANTLDTVTAATASTSGHVLRYNGTTVAFGQVAYADISGTPTIRTAAVNELVYASATVNSGTATLTAFFTNAPITSTVTVFFNGLRLRANGFSVSGSDLVLDITNIGYSLESGDVIGADYTY